MKKLSAILFENDNEEEVLSQPFLKDYRKLNLYHSTRSRIKNMMYIPFRFREKPRDTIQEMHDVVNQKSKEKYGIPVRNLLFTYPYSNKRYGDMYIIVPIGEKYRMFFSEGIEDMTADMNVGDRHQIFIEKFRDEKSLHNKMVEKIVSETENKLTGKYLNYLISKKYGYVKSIDTDTTFKIFHLFREDSINVPDAGSNSDFDDLEKKIPLITQKINDFVETWLDQEINSIAKKYVDNLKEIVPGDEDIIIAEEIMVYAPDGFYIIPVDDARRMKILKW